MSNSEVEHQMLDRIIQIFKKPSRFILFVGSIVVFALTMLSGFGNIGGDFFPVFIGIIVLLATLCATATVPVLLILKKDDIAKIVFVVLAGYWLISSARGQLGNVAWVGEGTALTDAAGVFSVLYGLCLLAIIVLIVLHLVLKNDFLKKVVLCVLAGAIVLGLVAMILWCVIYGKYNSHWTVFIDEICSFVAIPVTVFGGCVYYFIDEAKAAQQPAPQVEEQPAQEEPEQPEIAGENQEN